MNNLGSYNPVVARPQDGELITLCRILDTLATSAGVEQSPVVNSISTSSGIVTIGTADVSSLAFSTTAATSGSIAVWGSVDGTNYLQTSYVALTTGGTSASFNAATATIGQVNTVGLSSIQFRASSLVGSTTITTVGTTSVSNVMLDNPLPAGTNVIGGTYSTPNVAAGTLVTQASTGYSTTTGTLTAATRKYLLIQNTGTTNTLYVTTDGTTPSATNGFTLAASGGGVVWDGSFVPNGAIKLASTGTNYSILWA